MPKSDIDLFKGAAKYYVHYCLGITRSLYMEVYGE